MEFNKLSKEAQATIVEVFKSNPSMQETFATVDGSCFQNKQFAFAHEKDMAFKAKSDKERAACYGVVTCKREEVLSNAKGKPAKNDDVKVTEADLADEAFIAKHPEAKLGDLIKDLKTV